MKSSPAATMFCMKPILHWLMLNWAWLVWPVATALLTWAVKRKKFEEWEQWALKRPMGALFFEILAALGWDIPKIKKALLRYTSRKSGSVPEDAQRVAGLPEPLKQVLNNPELRQRIVAEAEKALAETTRPTPPA